MAKLLTISDRLRDSRDNNFDFLRFVAASMVVLGHSVPLSYGEPTANDGGRIDPLNAFSHGQTNLGGLAVAVFFVISGFLITQSFERSSSARQYLAKRCLRIFPGLTVAVLLTAFVLGPMVSAMSPIAYFSDIHTYTYLVNITLFAVQSGLPGVFTANPLQEPVVNGSLWTLWPEFVCYLVVLGLGSTGLLRWPVLLALLLACTAVMFSKWDALPLLWRLDLNRHLAGIRHHGFYLTFFSFFAGGGLIYLLRERVPHRGSWAIAAFLVLILAARMGGFDAAFAVAGSYLVIYLAFWPALPVGRFAEHGDFSYGTYIYAFPIQQSVVSYLGAQANWFTTFMMSYPLILVCAFASWHLVEHPALNLKSRLR